MKTLFGKLLFFVVLHLLVISCSSDTNSEGNSGTSDDSGSVLICESEDAYAYHDHECRGFNECDASSSWVSIDEARSMGRTPCGYCY